MNTGDPKFNMTIHVNSGLAALLKVTGMQEASPDAEAVRVIGVVGWTLGKVVATTSPFVFLLFPGRAYSSSKPFALAFAMPAGDTRRGPCLRK